MHLSAVPKFIRGANLLRFDYVWSFFGFFLGVTKKLSSGGKKLFGRKNFSGIFSCALPKIRKPVRLCLLKTIFIYGVAYPAIQYYNCEIWGRYLIGKTDSVDVFKNKIFKLSNDTEKLHLKFCKRIFGVHSKSTNLAVYTGLGRMP